MLFRKDIEPRCTYCRYAAPAEPDTVICRKNQPQKQCGTQGNAESPSEAQSGDGGYLTGKNGGDRVVPAQDPGQNPDDSGGEKAVKQLAEEVGAGTKSALPNKGQHLAMDRQSGPTQNKGSHAHAAPKGGGHISQAPNAGGHFNGTG